MDARQDLRGQVSEAASDVIDRSAVNRRRRSWPRRGALAVLVVLAAALTSACQGPTATTTIDVRARCIGVALGNPGPDFGEFTIRIEMGAPEWADEGETVSLSDMRVTTYDLFDLFPPGTVVEPYVGMELTEEGLSFGEGFVAPYDPDRTTEVGSRDATVDGAAGSLGTVRVQTITLGQAHAYLSCTPVAGSPTRLAAIEIR